MFRLLLAGHRFLLRQAFYPLALSTFLALTIYGGRVYLSENWLVYRNLLWNLFLAWLPYFFSLAAALLYRLSPRYAWLLIPLPGFLWLIFFPNAPYIVTDFLHLEQRPYVPLWYDILLISSFAWTGIFLAVASLRMMQILVRAYLGNVVSWFFVAFALGLSALGIYLGRFQRWNSWDLLFHPGKILADVTVRVINPLDNLRFVGFTALFTLFLLICYLVFISFSRLEESA
ncbi:MAG TPA: DUF1361 domain-containing protein [Anaerolineales bacterium]|nr:DUF1361 domain-containing protein [Anaerolineales bacterium]